MLTRAHIGQAPTDAAISTTGTVYVTRAFAATVERLDLSTLRSVVSIPVGCNPTRLVFDHSGRRAYVTNQFSSSISVIDVSTDTVIDEILVMGDPAPIVLAPDQQTLYVATNLDQLFAINLNSKRIVATIALPAASHHLALHPNRKRLYVATRSAGTVMEIDVQTQKVLRNMAVGGQTQAVAVDATGAEIYIANEAGGMDVVNLTTGTLVTSLRLDAGAYGLSLSPDNARLYVGLPSAGRVEVLDRASLRLVHTIHTGGVPRHTVFARDGRTALIVNEAGWIDIIA